MISYEPLWKTMKEKSVSQYHLLKCGIDNRVLHRLRHNQNVTVLSLEKICKILDCNIEDVVKIEKDEVEQEEEKEDVAQKED